jgi:hypothetical protein
MGGEAGQPVKRHLHFAESLPALLKTKFRIRASLQRCRKCFKLNASLGAAQQKSSFQQTV